MNKKDIIKIIKKNPNVSYSKLRSQAITIGLPMDLFEEAWKEVNSVNNVFLKKDIKTKKKLSNTIIIFLKIREFVSVFTIFLFIATILTIPIFMNYAILPSYFVISVFTLINIILNLFLKIKYQRSVGTFNITVIIISLFILMLLFVHLDILKLLVHVFKGYPI